MNGPNHQTVEQQVRDVISRLTAIEDDWDGQGAVVPDPAAIEHAGRVAARLFDLGFPPPNRVFALNSGEPLLEWDDGPAHFEIEIQDADTLSWMWWAVGANPRHGRALDDEAVAELTRIVPPARGPEVPLVQSEGPAMIGCEAVLVDRGQLLMSHARRDSTSVPAEIVNETV